MAPLSIITSASIGTSSIAAPTKKTHPEARFKSKYGKHLTIHSLTLYLNKIKMFTLLFRIEAHAIHPSIQFFTY